MIRAALVASLLAGAAAAEERIVGAEFHGPTDRYDHCVLGDCLEWDVLEIVSVDAEGARFSRAWGLWPADFVFEDLGPRLWDVTGDGAPEVVVVRSSFTEGAALVVYGLDGVLAETDPIGQRNRWLAPVGARDMDGDGRIEIAFVDRPHLAKRLRIFEYRDGALVHEADVPGLSNHQIGQAFITSAVRDCVDGSGFVTLNADWTRIMVTEWTGSGYEARDIGAVSDGSTGQWNAFLDVALDCDR